MSPSSLSNQKLGWVQDITVELQQEGCKFMVHEPNLALKYCIWLMQCFLKTLILNALKWTCIFSSPPAHHSLLMYTHLLHLFMLPAWPLKIKWYISAPSPLSVTSLLLKSMIHTKDDFLRLSLSISNSKNVYNSLGVRTSFRNVKITTNALVFSSTKNK